MYIRLGGISSAGLTLLEVKFPFASRSNVALCGTKEPPAVIQLNRFENGRVTAFCLYHMALHYSKT
jgi:hypothetical protein